MNPVYHIVASPMPDAADVPGTLPREVRTARLLGWMNRPDNAQDALLDEAGRSPETEFFFEGCEGEEAAAENAWMLMIGPASGFIYSGDLDRALIMAGRMTSWAQMNILIASDDPLHHRFIRVEDTDLDRIYPSWRNNR